MTYSGKFVIRVGEDLHRRLALEARSDNLSLNEVCKNKLAEEKTTYSKNNLNFKELLPTDLSRRINSVDNKEITSVWIPKSVGIVLFGSSVIGENFDTSDLDLLFILKKEIMISRSIYKDWDNSIQDINISPHFVSGQLLTKSNVLSSLWLEIATTGIVVYDTDCQVQKSLIMIRKSILEGKASREKISNAAYWKLY